MCMRKIRKCIDFIMVAAQFPSTAKMILRSSKIQGLSSFIDKAFLYILAQRVCPQGDVLEIGSYKGSSSLLLAAGNAVSSHTGRVWLVDPCFQPSREVFVDNFKKYDLDGNITMVEKPSEDARRLIDARFNLIFIDGLHEYSYVKKDILLWKDSLVQGGVIAFHDIQLKDVVRAINDFIVPCTDFIVQGIVGGILYASKGASSIFKFDASFERFRSLNCFREKVLSFGKVF
jgi:predicted O-methyltransferase YrrM